MEGIALDEQLLRRLEIITPLVHCYPVPWDKLSEQAQKSGCSPRTLQRWIKLYREGGEDALRGVKQEGKSGKHKGWEPFIREQYLTPQRLSIATVHGACLNKAHREDMTPPSYATVRRMVCAIPKSVQSYYRNSKEFRDRFQVTGELYQATYPGELFLIDHRRLDLLIFETRDRTGKALRPWITVVLDQYSRGVAGYYLGFGAPCSRSIALALRHAILPKADPNWPMCGIPNRLRHDHGQDMVSKYIQQVKVDLHIATYPKEKGNPRGNAEIERFFGTMAKWERKLPGWTGNSLKERPEKIEPTLSLPEIDRELRSFFHDYHRRRHGTTKMPPIERWNTGCLPRLPESEAALDLLLLPIARPYKIRRDGIHFQTNRYWCDELLLYIGETVVVRYDPSRLSAIVIYVGNERIGTAALVSGTRQTHAAYRKKREKQIEVMRGFKKDDLNSLSIDQPFSSSLPERDSKHAPGQEASSLSAACRKCQQDKPPKRLILFPIPKEGAEWC